jgi:predicted GTPase
LPVDPRPYAVGSIRETFDANPHLGLVLPAMGYSAEQRRELEETIHTCCAEEGTACVVDACPGRLQLALRLEVPVARVSYRFRQVEGPPLLDLAAQAIGNG